jgi:hypothetical protein
MSDHDFFTSAQASIDMTSPRAAEWHMTKAIFLSALVLGTILPLPGAEEPFLVPVVTGSWITITGQPDLGALTSDKQQPVDFAIWQAADGKWQLLSCIRGTSEAGKSRLFHRWESPDLLAPDWKAQGIAMRADPSLGETAGGLQAPFVTRRGDRFHMLYGDWARICSAHSADGRLFTRDTNGSGQPAVFGEGPEDNARDPFVIEIGGASHCYYTAHPRKKGAVFCRKSSDGWKTWSAAKIVAQGGQAGEGPCSAECPFVVEHGAGRFYLFRTQKYGEKAETRVYHSRDPENFGVAGKNGDAMHFVTTLPVAAPEIVRRGDEWFIATLRPDLKGHRIARLEWQPLAQPSPAAAPGGGKIRVALFDDYGSFGKGVPSCSAQLQAAGRFEVTKLDGDGIRAGLSGCHAVVFSGGSGSKQANTIGLRGREEVRRFVEAGGGYVGICAGAYLACSGFSWSVPVLDAKTPSPLWLRGTGNLQIETLPAGMKLLDLPARAEVRYANGPVITPGLRDDIRDYEPLVLFRSELAKDPRQAGLQINTPAMVLGHYGKGRVLACSPHPEQTAGMERWIERAIMAVLPP